MIEKEKFALIIDEVKSYLLRLAHEHDFQWFFDLHQLEVVKCAELLLDKYPDANREIVLVAVWLHDVVQFIASGEEERDKVKMNHHLDGAVKAKEILEKYQLGEEELEKIQNCIRRHRNKKGYEAVSIEEKIVASADAMSHFYSVFFLTFFKFHPSVGLDEMVVINKEKIERDWRDVNIIPEAGNIVRSRYENLKNMHSSYKSDFSN